MRFAIWGVGERLKKYVDKLNMELISCFVDAQKRQESFFGKQVISPHEIKKWEIDYFVISSNQFFDEIALRMVTELGIDVKNILNFETFLHITGMNGTQYIETVKLIDLFYDISLSYHFSRFLDVGMFFGQAGYWREQDLEVDGCAYGKDIFLHTRKPYRHIWKTEDIRGHRYDLAVIFQPEKENLLSFCNQLAEVSEHVFVRISEELFWDDGWIQKLGLVNFRGYLFGGFAGEKADETIFEVSHKEFTAIGDLLYEPLYVGTAKQRETGVLRDDSGEHIAHFNAKINECTALYWIWKNTALSVIGLNHYRRFFQSPINPYSPIQRWELEQIVKRYDICVAHPAVFAKTVKEMLNGEIDEEAFQAVYPKIEKMFQAKGGSEYEAFCYVMRSHMIYPCNMFLTTREVLDKYCTWLFPILFQLLEEVEIKEEWDAYSKRVIGFFAERLLTVWLVQQDYSVKELPILFVDEKGTT